MKKVALGLMLLFGFVALVQGQPDPRDSVIVESKLGMPGADPGPTSDTSAYIYVKVSITNKDTLANITLPVEIRSTLGGGFAILGYPRNFDGTMSRLTPTLGNNPTFSSFANSASPDTALWAGFWDPTDTTTAEPPNAFRKAFWELKFDTVKSMTFPGFVRIDSAVIFDNRVGFVSIGGSTVGVNFVEGFITIDACGCIMVNCGGAGGNVLYGRSYSFDFDADQPGKWSVFIGPGSIDSLTGVYTFSGQCALGAIPVQVHHSSDFYGCSGCDCQFTLNIIDNFPNCSTVQETVFVSHGQAATNQINATDPDAGEGFVFTKLGGPGAVNSSGAWSYSTSCSDVGASPQAVQIRTSDAYGSCSPGPGSRDCEFQLVVTNATPTVTNCPADVIPVDTGQAFSLQLMANDADPADGGNLSWFLVSAPAGLSLSSSGLLQWTPSGGQWGLKSATVQVRDGCMAAANCQIHFSVSLQKGDLNADGRVTPADFVSIVNCVYLGAEPPAGLLSCDLNCNGENTSADAVLLLNFVYLGAGFPC